MPIFKKKQHIAQKELAEATYSKIKVALHLNSVLKVQGKDSQQLVD
uniref:Uncharacterized protein n=1 Tax=Arundo donax TaxID=35708 RepID=A0A0A9F6U9_ARUDO